MKAELKTFEELENAVIEWAVARQIIPNSTTQAQYIKTVSEIGELADAVQKQNADDIMDAIGDVTICLINLAALCDVSFIQCLQYAYNQIKDRKGTLLPSGIFVKEETK